MSVSSFMFVGLHFSPQRAQVFLAKHLTKNTFAYSDLWHMPVEPEVNDSCFDSRKNVILFNILIFYYFLKTIINYYFYKLLTFFIFEAIKLAKSSGMLSQVDS